MNENTVECPNCGHINEVEEGSNKCICQECKEEFKVFVIYSDPVNTIKKRGSKNPPV